MKKLFTILLLSLGLMSYGHMGRFNPFKIIVIKPDTAIIDKSLFADIDSIQSDYIKRYYNTVKEMEELINSKYFENDTSFRMRKEQMKVDLVNVKALEPEKKQFKFYQALSAYSTEVYNFYFNEYEPFSTIIESPNQKTDVISIITLADSAKADFVIYFSNIHTELIYDSPVLKLTTSLYSKREKKIILVKETEGDTTSRGDMWTCGGTTLSCLLINGVRTSTDEVTRIIAKKQMRK